MCGRFTIATPLEYLAEWFGVNQQEFLNFRPRYNAAPGQSLPVISSENPQQISLFRWGLIPRWAKDAKIGYRMINARSETIMKKSAFKGPFMRRRCLVLADSFFEWDKKKKIHVPYRINLKNREPFAFAGITDFWKDNQGKEIQSFSIITTKANSLIYRIHDRMPVILSKSDNGAWLDLNQDADELYKLLKPMASSKLEMHQVSTLVNNPKNDNPEILNPSN